MKWRPSSSVTLPAPGYVEPCIPTRAAKPPSGAAWIFELKHDGYRLMVRKDGREVRIYSKRGADFTSRYPRIVEATRRLRATSALIDGEGVVYDQHGMPSFDLIYSQQYDREASLIAFDVLEINGEDVRGLQLLERKARLQKLIGKVGGIEFNEHIAGDGAKIFKHACKLGHEGIVAKRKDLPYESGRSKRWLKIKNPDAPATRRIEEGTF